MSNIYECVVGINIYDLQLDIAHLHAENTENVKIILKPQVTHVRSYMCPISTNIALFIYFFIRHDYNTAATL